MPALPDFVGIGALKAGTSYLDAMLRDHPGLALPPWIKEVEYFSRHVDRGSDWYEAQFPDDDGRRRGEISPQYLFDPRAADRVHAANPDARIILSVRHPVERVVSQYRHWVQETAYRGDFDRFLEEHPDAITRSRYAELLQPWLAAFGPGALHVVVFDDMRTDPLRAIQDVYRFLGVADTHVPAAVGKAVNATSAPRHPHAYAMAKRLARAMNDRGHARSVALLRRAGARQVLRGHRPVEVAASPQTLARLREGYRDDVVRLSELIGRDLSSLWFP